MRRNLFFTLSALLVSVLLPFMPGGENSAYAEEIQFNTDIMDVDDKDNIDVSQFSRRGFIMPGRYLMAVRINQRDFPEQDVTFYSAGKNLKESLPCLTREDVAVFGLKPQLRAKLAWWHQEQCLDITSIAGMTVQGDLARAELVITLPESWLEYRAPEWDPPSRWDEGIAGALLDYNLSMQALERQQEGWGYNMSGNGVTGMNIDAWRLRAEWQGSAAERSAQHNSRQQTFDWSRYYAWRAIPSLRARMTLGEDYLNSALFDSFRFAGASLRSDDNMLPPGLRGYAPEVTGVARTNAKVTVSQQGRVLYETQVPAGAFRIQELNDALTGELDVRIEEQDGSVQYFQLDTATIPYLTRPGAVRYKLAAGKPAVDSHQLTDPAFAVGEFSWGMTNNWSAYGGALAGKDYQTLSVGMGRDLSMYGAVALDSTLSRAVFAQDETLHGNAWRLSYAKRFAETDSQFTFAGYRFADRHFMTMPDYLTSVLQGVTDNRNKQRYTLSFYQRLAPWHLGIWLNYSYQAGWDHSSRERYDVTFSHDLNLGRWKNINTSLALFRNQYRHSHETGGWLSLSVPWGSQSTLSYNLALNNQRTEQNVSYYGRRDQRSSYQLSAGSSHLGGMFSGFYVYEGDNAQLSANARYQHHSYRAAGMAAQGGVTLTSQGGALHRITAPGSTRLLVDTEGVANVPVQGYGSPVMSNSFGKAVISEVSSYYRNSARIDVENLSDQAEATRSVVQATLTEGAIGYRQFHVIAGLKAMATIRLTDGRYPPFGALVRNVKQQQTGMVSEGGNVWLSGIRAGEKMLVEWGEGMRCSVELPATLPQPLLSDLLLPCRS